MVTIRQLNVLREAALSLGTRVDVLERRRDEAPSEHQRLEGEVVALRERVDRLESARERDAQELASMKAAFDALKSGIELSCHSLLPCIDVDPRTGVKRSHSDEEGETQHSQRRRDNASSAMRLDRIL